MLYKLLPVYSWYCLLSHFPSFKPKYLAKRAQLLTKKLNSIFALLQSLAMPFKTELYICHCTVTSTLLTLTGKPIPVAYIEVYCTALPCTGLYTAQDWTGLDSTLHKTGLHLSRGSGGSKSRSLHCPKRSPLPSSRSCRERALLPPSRGRSFLPPSREGCPLLSSRCWSESSLLPPSSKYGSSS